MKCFVIGATGYIGGSVAHRLKAKGTSIVGLTRSPEGADRLRAMREIALGIGRRLCYGDEAAAWPMAEAVREWGLSAHSTFASNSRVSAAKARAMLDWHPSGPTLAEEVARM